MAGWTHVYAKDDPSRRPGDARGIISCVWSVDSGAGRVVGDSTEEGTYVDDHRGDAAIPPLLFSSRAFPSPVDVAYTMAVMPIGRH